MQIKEQSVVVLKKTLIIALCAIFVAFLFLQTTLCFVENMKKTNLQTALSKIVNIPNTGAASASIDKKGGAIYVEAGSVYTFDGEVIDGKSNTYGGAVFIETGATFIMNSGLIQNCSADYGGAIYVREGATCKINGGEFSNCTASKNGPIIYLEKGAIFSTSVTIKDSDIFDESKQLSFEISDTTEVMGDPSSSTIKFRTIKFGSYPQTYVGDSMNTTLENWYSSYKPQLVKSYTLEEVNGELTTWNSYLYSDGNYYARGTCFPGSYGYTYKNGESVRPYEISWFKVEPIKWYILNYSTWKNGKTDLELFSVLALACIMFDHNALDWASSKLRAWMNDQFYNSAFSETEQSYIAEVTLKNSTVNQHYYNPSDWTGEKTKDKIYCLTCYDLSSESNRISKVDYSSSDPARICSPTDFLVGNWCREIYTTHSTSYRDVAVYWWTRTPFYHDDNCIFEVREDGTIWGSVPYAIYGVRPSMHLKIRP